MGVSGSPRLPLQQEVSLMQFASLLLGDLIGIGKIQMYALVSVQPGITKVGSQPESLPEVSLAAKADRTLTDRRNVE